MRKALWIGGGLAAQNVRTNGAQLVGFCAGWIQKVLAVGNPAGFPEAYAGVFRRVCHKIFVVFSSDRGLVLPAFHKTYRNNNGFIHITNYSRSYV